MIGLSNRQYNVRFSGECFTEQATPRYKKLRVINTYRIHIKKLSLPTEIQQEGGENVCTI